jgi:hypothetical protein
MGSYKCRSLLLVRPSPPCDRAHTKARPSSPTLHLVQPANAPPGLACHDIESAPMLCPAQPAMQPSAHQCSARPALSCTMAGGTLPLSFSFKTSINKGKTMDRRHTGLYNTATRIRHNVPFTDWLLYL